MKRYIIKTFGCQMNSSDSERVAGLLERMGFSPAQDGASADLIVINTCSVRQKSEDKAVGYIANRKKQSPTTIIAVTGCMVRQTGDKDTSSDELLRLGTIDIVFRIEDAARLPKLLERHFPKETFDNPEDFFGVGTLENYFRIVPKVENTVQAFVPIMQGCDKFCTYCIVPYTRGREISRDMEEIVEECAYLVAGGAKEITLLGQNVNSYTHQGEKVFPGLLRRIDRLHEQGLSRVRFTSPHPQDMTPECIETLAAMRTACPYIHLPAQHGSDRMLRAMNRNYTVEQYETIVRQIRTAIPTCAISTDIIVGFPGETEEDVQQLLDFARRMAFDFSFTAIFSPRRNTPAARMKADFIDAEEKKKRFHRFDGVIKESAFANRRRCIGTSQEVLVENVEELPEGGFRCTGRSREFYEVQFESTRPMRGREVMVDITEQVDYLLLGNMQQEETPAPSARARTMKVVGQGSA